MIDWQNCGDPEGWGPWSPTRNFDFTICFQYLIIDSIPFIFLFLFGLPRLFILMRRSSPNAPKMAFYYLRFILISIVLIINVALFVLYLLKEETNTFFISKKAFKLAGYVFAMGLHHVEYTKSKVSSAVLLFFWLFSLIASALQTWSLIIRDVPSFDLVHFAGHITNMALFLVIFVVEMQPKPHQYYLSLDDDINVTREENANIFSRLTFSWMDPLMKLGYQKDLDMDDLWNLKKLDTAVINSDHFQTIWQEELLKETPSFVKALFKAYGPVFAWAAVFKVCQDCLAFAQPQLLKQIMAFATSWTGNDPEHPPEPLYKGFIIACLMLLAAVCQTICLHQYFHVCLITGMRIKAALVTAVYRKALTLSNKSKQSSTVGEIVNLMSVDAGRIMDLSTYLHIVWSGPLQMCLALYFLYQTLGPAIFAGVAVMVTMIPINGWLAAKSRTYNKMQMKNKDTRTKLMDEFLNGIKVIKLYAWEIPFLKKINNVRESELGMLKKIAYLSAMQTFTWSCTPFLVSFSSFALYSFISDEPLTSSKVFVSLSLFNLLQFPLAVFPSVISSIIEASVSFGRLYDFFTSEELDKEAVLYEPVTPKSSSEDVQIDRVQVDNGHFSWEPVQSANQSFLKEISFDCSDGCLFSIVGSVGSGKSSIISALLGEMYKAEGKVVVRGSIAFVPQTAWIMNATVRDNILFGNRYDAKFYKETVSACGLESDLEMLAAGDMTEIGERGINLSGGQKQRISLARAVYARADIYLLDDSLSAVDAHVGKHIFEKVIGPKSVLKDKARIFVTHGIQYLSEANKIAFMEDGRIAEMGTYRELMQRKGLTYTLLKEYGKCQDGNQSNDRINEGYSEHLHTRGSSTNTSTTPSHSRSVSTKKLDQKEKVDTLITKEVSAKGSVSWSVYKTYADSCSWTSVVCYLFIAVLSQALSVSQNLYLATWAGENDKSEQLDPETFSNSPSSDKSHIFEKLGIYGILGLSYSGVVILQVIFVWVFCGIRSARMLHQRLLDNMSHLPMSFFDTTPLGRILNRFSKDIYTVDEVLPRSFQGYFRTLFAVLSVLAVNSLSSPWFLAFAVPLGILYMYFQKFYLSTSRELKRLDSTSRSPIYAHFQETLGGVTSIRAYKQEHRFIATNEERVDFNKKAYYPSVSYNRWLAVRLEFIGALIVFGSAMFAVVSIKLTGHVDASLVGLAITYSLTVTQTLNWMVRMSCEIESQIISVERIKEYAELPQEAPYEHEENPNDKLSESWPENGVIEFQDYSTRYREGMDLVLKNITFEARPGEKIGIVGRTGAGKSSLTLALFRIIEPATGTIVIDDVDVRVLGLKDLRSRLTIIPQDPVLFSGTLRQNLDPFESCSDADLWAVLESAHLKSYISKQEEKLNLVVLQGGENFSVGQRQLICLARALLRKTNILILDEATAAIDVETDTIIQETIRKEFNNCTILTIAHRINTVLDYDRILVLDKGSIVELDAPKQLLKDRKSKFYSLAKEAGLA